MYAAKYKHCLNRAISLVKSFVNKRLQETTTQVTNVVQASNATNAQAIRSSTSNEEFSIFPLIYGNFSAEIAKLKKLFSEIEKRRNALPE